VETLMPHAIQILETCGPEVLHWTPIEIGEPGSGQVRCARARRPQASTTSMFITARDTTRSCFNLFTTPSGEPRDLARFRRLGYVHWSASVLTGRVSVAVSHKKSAERKGTGRTGGFESI
jgi:hypothetical protein